MVVYFTAINYLVLTNLRKNRAAIGTTNITSMPVCPLFNSISCLFQIDGYWINTLCMAFSYNEKPANLDGTVTARWSLLLYHHWNSLGSDDIEQSLLCLNLSKSQTCSFSSSSTIHSIFTRVSPSLST